MAYGTFGEEDAKSSIRVTSATVTRGAFILLGVIATVAIIYAASPSPSASVRPVLIQKARQQQLSWNGFTLEMQQEADKALRLCKVGLMGKRNQEKPHGCVKHVVPTTDTAWTHSEAGQNEWEETQNVLTRQVSVAPLGPDIGTPGDFGDRR